MPGQHKYICTAPPTIKRTDKALLAHIKRRKRELPKGTAPYIAGETEAGRLILRARPISLADGPVFQALPKNFRWYASLRCGRDEFSKLGLPALLDRISAKQADQIRQAFEDEADQATCIRWMLRGLSLTDAVRKIAVGHEIAANAAAR